MIRIQRMRQKGWRKPPGAIDCTRSGRWGNSYRVREMLAPIHGFVVLDAFGNERAPVYTTKAEALQRCVELFTLNLRTKLAAWPEYLEPLRGHDLMCWCASGQSCHADILLALANEAAI